MTDVRDLQGTWADTARHTAAGQYTDADYAAEAARVRTGVCPVDAEWDHARTAHEAADRLITFTDLSLPVPIREALDALSGLLAVWDGEGEDE